MKKALVLLLCFLTVLSMITVSAITDEFPEEELITIETFDDAADEEPAEITEEIWEPEEAPKVIPEEEEPEEVLPPEEPEEVLLTEAAEAEEPVLEFQTLEDINGTGITVSGMLPQDSRVEARTDPERGRKARRTGCGHRLRV